MSTCVMMHILDQIVKPSEKITELQLCCVQLEKEKEEMEAVLFEARAEEVKAQTVEVLEQLEAQWSNWVSVEGADEEHVYQVEKDRAESVLFVIDELKREKQNQSCKEVVSSPGQGGASTMEHFTVRETTRIPSTFWITDRERMRDGEDIFPMTVLNPEGNHNSTHLK